MRTSIRIKFILSYLILAATMLGIMNIYGRHLMMNYLVQEEKAKLYQEADQLSQNYISNVDSLNTALSNSLPQVRRQFSSLQSLTQNRYWLVDDTGNILIDSSSLHSKEGRNLNHYDNSFLTYSSYMGSSLSKLVSGEIVSVIYPLTINLKTTGYIVLFLPSSTLRTRAVKYIDVAIVCFFLFFIALFLVFIYLIHQISRPVQSMTTAVRQYTDGNFDYKIKKQPGREYQNLADALQYLSDNMKNMNDYQKKFIANVSHDFRSPLTSIKGYAEALIDGTIPPEMQGKYLNIILFETQRLTKLTSSLLELNQFEYKGFMLDITTFDINQAIKMTTATFEQRCTEKRISIDLIFSHKALLVDADINKIEQVIQNLVDNAIKFSHHDSSIEIHTLERTGKIFVSVKDHGIGIPKDSLGKVWNRFYKTDLSRGRDKVGTGLGLSITKEILQAHNENINVISTEGAGTEFIFSLPAHKHEEESMH